MHAHHENILFITHSYQTNFSQTQSDIHFQNLRIPSETMLSWPQTWMQMETLYFPCTFSLENFLQLFSPKKGCVIPRVTENIIFGLNFFYQVLPLDNQTLRFFFFCQSDLSFLLFCGSTTVISLFLTFIFTDMLLKLFKLEQIIKENVINSLKRK